MEAKLRYQKELHFESNRNSNSKPKKKKLDYPQNGKINKIDITHSAPKKIPNAYGEPRIDFIQKNIEQAPNQKSRVKMPKPENQKEKILNQKHLPGEIPQSSKRVEKNMQIVFEDGTVCPIGMRPMSDNEKASSIKDLTEQKEDILSSLNRLPLTIESLQLQKNKQILDQHLIEIESALEQLQKNTFLFQNNLITLFIFLFVN